MDAITQRMIEIVDTAQGLEANYARFVPAAMAAIEIVAGPNSAYARSLQTMSDRERGRQDDLSQRLAGILFALRLALERGHTVSPREIVHGEVFADFLEQADHLVSNGYKDAAAVIAGSTLEAHLRALAGKHPVDVKYPDGRPKKADTLNSELTSKGAYTILDQKNVVAWLDLRNKAAHGKYGEYTKDQVALMIQAIRDFMARLPA